MLCCRTAISLAQVFTLARTFPPISLPTLGFLPLNSSRAFILPSWIIRRRNLTSLWLNYLLVIVIWPERRPEPTSLGWTPNSSDYIVADTARTLFPTGQLGLAPYQTPVTTAVVQQLTSRCVGPNEMTPRLKPNTFCLGGMDRWWPFPLHWGSI